MSGNYGAQIRALLPPGAAWEPEPGTAIGAFVDGLAVEFGRVEDRALALIEEADPRTTTELLGDWERICSLPGKCAQPTTLAGRRAAVASRLTGNSPPIITRAKQLAQSLGYSPTFVTYWGRGFECIAPCDDELFAGQWGLYLSTSACTDVLYGEQWVFVWSAIVAHGANDDVLVCLLKDMTQDQAFCFVQFT